MVLKRVKGQDLGAAAIEDTAVLVPLEAFPVEGNESNLRAKSRTRTRMRLALRSDGPDALALGKSQVVTAKVPNWLRVVFYYAGSNEPLAEHLPAAIEVSVTVDGSTRSVVSVDVDRAATELEPYRDVATKWWKEDEGMFSGARGLLSAPRFITGEIADTASTWRQEAARFADDIRGDGPAVSGHDESDIDKLRRSGNMLAPHLAANPKKFGPIRASALQAGPMMVDNFLSGAIARTDLEAWLTLQESSGAVTADEASAWRSRAFGE